MTLDRSYEMAQFQEILGERIKSQRRSLGLTQVELAGRVGISRASIANIETGLQRTSSFLLVQLAEVLNIVPTELLPSLSEVATSLQQNQQSPVLVEGELISKELRNLNIPVGSDYGLEKALEEIQDSSQAKKGDETKSKEGTA
ncbi:MAG: helix-turn-helix transcriptional regulator [Gammaproteobacteria bacterium]|nr:helix-turn-helix transcriptional regulator [Gammaproteobacteria bacterium]